jgi:hypothetical protein
MFVAIPLLPIVLLGYAIQRRQLADQVESDVQAGLVCNQRLKQRLALNER